MTHQVNIPEINYTVTDGMFACRVRRLQTFTVTLNEKSGRYMVADDQKDGRIVGVGYATVDAAVKAYEREDFRRVGLGR